MGLVLNNNESWSIVNKIVNLVANGIILFMIAKILSSDDVALWYLFGAIFAIVGIMEGGFLQTISRHITYIINKKESHLDLDCNEFIKINNRVFVKIVVAIAVIALLGGSFYLSQYKRIEVCWQEYIEKFASQIMTSKSPVRSAEDIDETALSYAEIKMLATGNPYIKEKMDLDIQVQKLKLLKSNFLSEKYALEDKIIKYYPQRITALENRIEGLKQDVETAKQHPKPTDDRFVGMEVKGVFYSEKADAGKAIIEACKQMNSPDPIPLGKYRGFETELLFNTAERN